MKASRNKCGGVILASGLGLLLVLVIGARIQFGLPSESALYEAAGLTDEAPSKARLHARRREAQRREHKKELHNKKVHNKKNHNKKVFDNKKKIDNDVSATKQIEATKATEEDTHHEIKLNEILTQQEQHQEIAAASSSCVDPSAGPVLEGADVVAYRYLNVGANATIGSADYAAKYGEYTFYFENAENRATFLSNPDKYVPKFGGFCSYGITNEFFWTKDTLGPNANKNVWIIYDDHLFVFMYCTPEHKFVSRNITEEIERGNQIWSTWWNDVPTFNTGCFWHSREEGGVNDVDETSYQCSYLDG
uniref:YHS domain-containing protein n=1 Tax=Aureoumbra lagunensis TaxID=44058 RepID=A0A7S3JR48_9STRA|mmetsp:Transcript_20368/g.26407  ORF Transcript_20368/g.26407 Transcript_20368/m.26407 type:complete len:306 (+) Transcript_20368:57-974(+)